MCYIYHDKVLLTFKKKKKHFGYDGEKKKTRGAQTHWQGLKITKIFGFPPLGCLECAPVYKEWCVGKEKGAECNTPEEGVRSGTRPFRISSMNWHLMPWPLYLSLSRNFRNMSSSSSQITPIWSMLKMSMRRFYIRSSLMKLWKVRKVYLGLEGTLERGEHPWNGPGKAS